MIETKLNQETQQFKVYSKVHLDNLVMKSNEKVDIQGFDHVKENLVVFLMGSKGFLAYATRRAVPKCNWGTG